ncbi:hypothetical protein ACFO0N_08920 [Halobium salinum]|uniref:Uncharacterized protein n=1 Tax=Halobium salinum TaxID=1364940 RepID=A0ABD5PAZ6_9EURY|nr:hypothetical protein [Halobium salinum]
MLRTLLVRLREWVAVEDAEDRVEGTGEAVLDPAYSGRYTAERELRRLSDAADAETDRHDER